MTSTQAGDLLDPDTVADVLDVKVRTLSQWRWRREGPPYVKVGRRVRYRRSDVDSWLAASRVAPGSERAS